MNERFENIDNKDGFDVVVRLNGTAAADATQYAFLYTASRPVELIKIELRYSVASSSGTYQVERITGTTALGSGTSVLTSTISLSQTANTTYRYTVVNFVRGTNTLREGESFASVVGGTLTGLSNLSQTFYFKPLGKGDYR